MTFANSISTCLTEYADFEGRALRSEYWWFILFQGLVGFGLGLLGAILGASDGAVDGISLVFTLAILLPTLAVTTRRLHDVSRSGWWQLIPITIVGMIPMLYWLCKSGEAQANQYGPVV